MNAPDTKNDAQDKGQNQLAYLEKVSWVLMGVAGIKLSSNWRCWAYLF